MEGHVAVLKGGLEIDGRVINEVVHSVYFAL